MTPQKPVTPQKHGARYFLRVPIRCRILDEDGGETELITETVNISAGGFFMRISERVKVGSEVALYFKLPTDMATKPISEFACRGRIAWEEVFLDGSYGYDVEIDEAAAPPSMRSRVDQPLSSMRH